MNQLFKILDLYSKTIFNNPSERFLKMHCTRKLPSEIKNNLSWVYRYNSKKKPSRHKPWFSSSFSPSSPCSPHLHNFIKRNRRSTSFASIFHPSGGPVSRSRASPRTCPARPRGGTDPRKVSRRRRRRCASRERWSVARSPARLLLSWPS